MESINIVDSMYNVRQSAKTFRSPEIIRKELGSDNIAAHSGRKSRRTKSNEPSNIEIDQIRTVVKSKFPDINVEPQDEEINKRWSLIAKNHETMSKQEMINNYRLLMNEKLRLERFLSIMTKNNEMARNRLESDLLDAMMCIEDLKQALEIRMARRRKVDPREAEERRYLIRQNKKLLNQLYEAAKKIERLEVTKLEMKEQLELLDFQIVEVENQKTIMEEELKNMPSTIHEESQTDETSFTYRHLTSQLKEELNCLTSELANQKAETAAALAKQCHLDNLVRELRRDNIELRDQLARVDDVENSLVESDKPIVADALTLKVQLDEKVEYIKELEDKLNSSRAYTNKLEFQLQQSNSKCALSFNGLDKDNEIVDLEGEEKRAFSSLESSKLAYVPKVEDLLLSQTICTYQALINEKDQEIDQLKRLLRQKVESSPSDTTHIEVPNLYETVVQTEITMPQMTKMTNLAEQLVEGGQLLSFHQYSLLNNELKRSLQSLLFSYHLITKDETSDLVGEENNSEEVGIKQVDELLECCSLLRQNAESLKLKLTLSGIKLMDTFSAYINKNATPDSMKLSTLDGKNLLDINENGLAKQEKSIVKGNVSEFYLSHSYPESNEPVNAVCTANYYSVQLEELKQNCDLEVARAHLNLSEHRRKELDRQITELTKELARCQAEARSAETSLSAARRTEAALRRRLLVALDVHESGEKTDENKSVRHSLGLNLGDTFECSDVIELQANLVKLQSTNTALTEAAMLDRTKLHDQAMRIDQLELEQKALLDKVSNMQISEAGAQRGIVRLRVLYEDMLRDYSNSKWRKCHKCERSGNVNEVNSIGSQKKKFDDNGFLSIGFESANFNANKILVGPCTSPACVAVRHLLKAFQGRYMDMVNQFQQPMTNASDSNSSMKLSSQCPLLLDELNKQLSKTMKLWLSSVNSSSQAQLMKNIKLCLRLLNSLEQWITNSLSQSDLEIARLRGQIMEIQLSSTTNSNFEKISLNSSKASYIEKCLCYEKEIFEFKEHLRQMEAQVQLTQAYNGQQHIFGEHNKVPESC